MLTSNNHIAIIVLLVHILIISLSVCFYYDHIFVVLQVVYSDQLSLVDFVPLVLEMITDLEVRKKWDTQFPIIDVIEEHKHYKVVYW